MRFLVILSFCALTISCSTRIELANKQEIASLSDAKYMECSFFADDTFAGRIFKTEGEKTCFDIYILKHPKDIFIGDKVFLHAYPFYAKGEKETKYGKALAFYSMSEAENKALIQSKTIDNYLLTKELKTTAKDYFKENYIRICDINTRQWNGVALVIYFKKNKYREPQLIRKTSILLPPILVDVDDFKNENGEELSQYHPMNILSGHFQNLSKVDIEEASDQLCLARE